MAKEPKQRFLDAIKDGIGLDNELVYHIDFEDYRNFPDPFPRTTFTVKEVQDSIERYPNPERPGANFRWDIHGRLLTPDKPSVPGVAVVMIHGGAANEYEFLFTPDGPEKYLDLTKVAPTQSRVGIAQHIASLGVTVLAISLPGHYSRNPWPPIASRKHEFVIGEPPGDPELKNRLAVYTFRMCLEAIKVLIETNLPDYSLYIWGHSTGGEFFYLMEQYGLKNKLIGGLGFGTGMTGAMSKEFNRVASETSLEERASKFVPITDVSRRSPEEYTETGCVGPNQPWGSAERWFELEDHRRPQIKPHLQYLEHNGLDVVLDEVRQESGLPDDELFICNRADLNRLRGKKMLYFVGEHDKGHWMTNAKKGLEFRREVYAARRLAQYADKMRLIVVGGLTHYGHIESHNERLANMMVTGFKDYFP